MRPPPIPLQCDCAGPPQDRDRSAAGAGSRVGEEVSQCAPHPSPCSVIALDHHKTAIDRLQAPVAEGELPLPANIDLSHLDLERSGATIARDYFAPQLTPSLQQMFRSVCAWA